MDFQRICIRSHHPWVQAVLYHFALHVILNGNYENEINYYLLKYLAQCPAWSECSIHEAIIILLMSPSPDSVCGKTKARSDVPIKFSQLVGRLEVRSAETWASILSSNFSCLNCICVMNLNFLHTGLLQNAYECM